MLMCKTEFKVD